MTIDISGIITMLKGREMYKMKEFQSALQTAVEYLHQCFILNSREYREAVKNGQIEFDVETDKVNLIRVNQSFEGEMKRKCSFSTPRNHLFIKYLFVKLLYLANSIGVFWYLNLIMQLEGGFTLFGIELLNVLISKDSSVKLWKSKNFPKQVFCDLPLKGDFVYTQEYQVQCTLPANVFYEKVFLFLWFWFFFVAILNFVSILLWIRKALARKTMMLSLKAQIEFKKVFEFKVKSKSTC